MTKTITSQVSPIRVGDSSGERRTIYTALQVTETENSEGVPIYTSKIIRYLNQRLEGPLSIAEGTTENPGVLHLHNLQLLKRKNFYKVVEFF